MDPLLFAALNFFLGILGGGLVAVFASVMTLRNMRSVEIERYARDGGDLLFALVAELDENIAACGDGTAQPGPAVRSIWEEARRFGASENVRRLLTTAYIAGTNLNRAIAAVDASRLQSSGDARERGIRDRDLAQEAVRAGQEARAAFVAARGALLTQIDELAPARPS